MQTCPALETVLGLIIPLTRLKTVMKPWARKPFTLNVKALYDPEGTTDPDLVQEIEGYFGIKVSPGIEEFCNSRDLELVLNLYGQKRSIDEDLQRLNIRGIPVIAGVAAEILWQYIVALEDLSIQQEVFFQALNSTVEGIQMADSQGIVVFVNDAFLNITNLRREDRLGKSVFEVSPDGGLAYVLEHKRSVKHLRNHPKGTNTELVSNAAPIFIHGNFYGAVSVMQDVTEIIYLSKELEKSKGMVDYLNRKVRHLTLAKYTFEDIVSSSGLMQEVKKIAKKAAAGDQHVLIQGESGTGKEMFAHAIHNASSRRSKPFIPLNCAAIPEQLLESELFGHEKGAFTGANTRKIGMFELAHTGTLFLDEIGDMSLSLQSKLLRVLQDEVFWRVGGNTPIKVDVRIIAATNRNLPQMVREGKFREDLFYRLNVINISIPPLRERLEDLPLLAEVLIAKISKRTGKKIKGLSREALQALKKYRWPGNVRELENVLERAILLCPGDIIQVQDLCLPETRDKKGDPIEIDEKEKIRSCLLKYGCSVEGKRKTARELNMSLATLYNKIKLYQLKDFYIRTPKS